jgi:hypothetical protein
LLQPVRPVTVDRDTPRVTNAGECSDIVKMGASEHDDLLRIMLVSLAPKEQSPKSLIREFLIRECLIRAEVPPGLLAR